MAHRNLVRSNLVFTFDKDVKDGTTVQYLDIGKGVNCFDVGLPLVAAATLIGIAVSVDVADASRNFDVEVVKDPAGTPAVLGSALALSNVTRNSRRDLVAAIAATDMLGVRLTRTSGTGKSSFKKTIVVVEIEMQP